MRDLNTFQSLQPLFSPLFSQSSWILFILFLLRYRLSGVFFFFPPPLHVFQPKWQNLCSLCLPKQPVWSDLILNHTVLFFISASLPVSNKLYLVCHHFNSGFREPKFLHWGYKKTLVMVKRSYCRLLELEKMQTADSDVWCCTLFSSNHVLPQRLYGSVTTHSHYSGCHKR